AVLNISAGKVVCISGELDNIGDANGFNNPGPIPLIEELAMTIRKKRAFPVVEISTTNLQQRFFREISDACWELPNSYYLQWVKALDCIIDVGWQNNPSVFSDAPQEQLVILSRYSREFHDIIEREGKKVMYLGFPTQSLATYWNISYDVLEKAYYESLNCDYKRLTDIAGQLNRILHHTSGLYIENGENRLDFSLVKSSANEAKLFESNHIVMPAGHLSWRTDSLHGVFQAEHVYYNNTIWHNVEVLFNQDVIEVVRFADENKGNNKLQNVLMNADNDIHFALGINDKLHQYTGCAHFDKVRNGGVMLISKDVSGEPLILFNRGYIKSNDFDNIKGDIIYV
ncbi:MAG: hypothetical protein K8S56_04640, partial [Candidatus Cloacimonetes bacterium]|nr:hypothetical protein [Candidatus Cloacimonadota bacterium]